MLKNSEKTANQKQSKFSNQNRTKIEPVANQIARKSILGMAVRQKCKTNQIEPTIWSAHTPPF